MNTVSTTATAWPFEMVPAAPTGPGQNHPSRPAALRVSATGHAALSAKAMDVLGWPGAVLIAAKDGSLIIKAAGPDDHRGYKVVIAVDPGSGNLGNARLCARSAFKAAGMLPPTGSVKYIALDCDAGDGKRALFVRRDVQIPVEIRMSRAVVSVGVSA